MSFYYAKDSEAKKLVSWGICLKIISFSSTAD